MHARTIACAFPLLLVGLAAMERVFTARLGVNPGYPLVWELSMTLRSIFGPSSAWLEFLAPLHLQIALLAVLGAMMIVSMSSPRWRTISVAANNGALLFVVGSTMAVAGSPVAAAGFSLPTSHIFLLHWNQLNGLVATMLILGTCAAIISHAQYLAQALADRKAHAAVVRNLGSGLDRRQPASRPSAI